MIMESAPIDRTMCRFLLPHSQENSLLKILSAYKTYVATRLLTLEMRDALRLEWIVRVLEACGQDVRCCETWRRMCRWSVTTMRRFCSAPVF